jgi:hypothetical protein
MYVVFCPASLHLLLLPLLLQCRGGLSKLQAHPWFRHLNWGDLKEGRTTVGALIFIRRIRVFCFASASFCQVFSGLGTPLVQAT